MATQVWASCQSFNAQPPPESINSRSSLLDLLEPVHVQPPNESPLKPLNSCLHTHCSIAMEFRIFGMPNKLPRPKPSKPLKPLSDLQPEPANAGSSVTVLSEPKLPDPDLVGSSVEILVWLRNDPPLSGTPELPLSITARAAGAAINKRGWLGLRLHSLLEKGEATGFCNEQRRKDGAAEEELREMGQFVDLMGQAQFLEKKKSAA